MKLMNVVITVLTVLAAFGLVPVVFLAFHGVVSPQVVGDLYLAGFFGSTVVSYDKWEGDPTQLAALIGWPVVVWSAVYLQKRGTTTATNSRQGSLMDITGRHRHGNEPKNRGES